MMVDVCILICSVTIILLALITLLDMVEIPKQLKRIADAMEKKTPHGKWINTHWRPKCSLCGFSGSLHDTPTSPFKYCPGCGARMDGK